MKIKSGMLAPLLCFLDLTWRLGEKVTETTAPYQTTIFHTLHVENPN